MKACKDCGGTKPVAEFGKSGKYLQPYCKPCASIRGKKWRLENPGRTYESRHKWIKENPRASTYWGRSNKDKKARIARKYRDSNKARIAKYDRQYRKDNIDAYRERDANKRTSRLHRRVAWADQAAIAEFYELAVFAEEETGVKYHVDHIIPLQGKSVSGLHVESNLQVITAKENMQKNNSF